MKNATCTQWRTVWTHDDKTHEASTHSFCLEWSPAGDPDAWHDPPEKERLTDPPGHGGVPVDPTSREHCKVLKAELASAKRSLDAATRDLPNLERESEYWDYMAGAAYERYRAAQTEYETDVRTAQHTLNEYKANNPARQTTFTRYDLVTVADTVVDPKAIWGEEAVIAQRQKERSETRARELFQTWGAKVNPEQRAAEERLSKARAVIAATPGLIAMLEQEQKNAGCV